MFPASRLDRFSLEEVIDPSIDATEFSEEFTAQFVVLLRNYSYRLATDKSYIKTSVVSKTASALILLICIYSLGLWFLSGLQIIHPLLAAIASAAAGIFYFMGTFIDKAKAKK
jgi:hypothetical protein